MTSTIQTITNQLNDAIFQGSSFNCLCIPGEQEVLQVVVSDKDEIPIYITVTETQILCIVYLFKEDEVIQGKLNEINERCLQLNVPMPLSAFAKIDDFYSLFGALSIESSIDNIMQEVVTLSDNSMIALETVEDLLI